MSYTDFSVLSDEQLAVMAQNGESGAVDCLIGRYLTVAAFKAKRMNEKFSLYDVDDLTQEAMIGLLSAIYSFHTDAGAGFSTYANVCMNNRLLCVASSMRAKHQIPDSAVSSIDELDGLTDRFANPEDSVISNCMADRITQLIGTELSDFEKKVLQLFLSGKKYAEIGKMLGADEKAADNAIQRIRRKLRSMIVK